MQISDEIRKCVAFLGYYNHKDEDYSLVGTIFFIGREIEKSGRWFHYGVTAKHTLDKLASLGVDKLYMRYNLVFGESQWDEIGMDNWYFHPNSSDSVDAAIKKLSIPEFADHLIIPTTLAATNEIIRDEAIGIGEEVF